MSILNLVCIALAVVSGLGGGVCAIRLYHWERLLRGARVTVHYKGKTAMTPRLIDWLQWIQKLEGDKAVKGQVIYKLGGTTITIRKPLPPPKQKTRTVKGDPHA